ncbi:dTMP kinase, partial [Treponema sp. R6D11]
MEIHGKAELVKNNVSVWTTRTPSDTKLGKFVRQIAETVKCKSLACLFAADRYNILDTEIIPNLLEKRVVIIDRYVLSSLILQRLDNVDTDFILSIHNHLIMPDLQVVVNANESIIRSRLNKRKKLLSRFEEGNRTSEEFKYLSEGIEIFHTLGIQTVTFDNSGNFTESVSSIT